MYELELIASITALFLVRIGLPMLALVIVGVLVDRWQSAHSSDGQDIRRQH